MIQNIKLIKSMSVGNTHEDNLAYFKKFLEQNRKFDIFGGNSYPRFYTRVPVEESSSIRYQLSKSEIIQNFVKNITKNPYLDIDSKKLLIDKLLFDLEIISKKQSNFFNNNFNLDTQGYLITRFDILSNETYNYNKLFAFINNTDNLILKNYFFEKISGHINFILLERNRSLSSDIIDDPFIFLKVELEKEIPVFKNNSLDFFRIISNTNNQNNFNNLGINPDGGPPSNLLLDDSLNEIHQISIDTNITSGSSVELPLIIYGSPSGGYNSPLSVSSNSSSDSKSIIVITPSGGPESPVSFSSDSSAGIPSPFNNPFNVQLPSPISYKGNNLDSEETLKYFNELTLEILNYFLKD